MPPQELRRSRGAGHAGDQAADVVFVERPHLDALVGSAPGEDLGEGLLGGLKILLPGEVVRAR
jgi:hypothetical protein